MLVASTLHYITVHVCTWHFRLSIIYIIAAENFYVPHMHTCISQSARKPVPPKFWPSTTISINHKISPISNWFTFPLHWLSDKPAYLSMQVRKIEVIGFYSKWNNPDRADLHSPCCFTKSRLQIHDITSCMALRKNYLVHYLLLKKRSKVQVF